MTLTLSSQNTHKMECRVKRSFFDRCQDYFNPTKKSAEYGFESNDDSSHSNENEHSDEEEDTCMAVAPAFRLIRPYQRVATKDTR